LIRNTKVIFVKFEQHAAATFRWKTRNFTSQFSITVKVQERISRHNVILR
jgi:hypothetical protein